MLDEGGATANGRAERGVLALTRWLTAKLGWISATLLTIGSALLAFSVTHEWLLWWGVGPTTLALVLQWFVGPKYSKLMTEHQAATQRAAKAAEALQKILRSGLRTVMADVDIDFQAARVSVYRHKGSDFFLLTRVSDSQVLERVGRRSYPVGEGIIGQAWDKGTAYARDLPEDRDEWNEHCLESYGIPRRTATQITMQSRSLLGLRVDAAGVDPQHLGLVVFESLSARGILASHADSLREFASFKLLQAILPVVLANLEQQDVDQFTGA